MQRMSMRKCRSVTSIIGATASVGRTPSYLAFAMAGGRAQPRGRVDLVSSRARVRAGEYCTVSRVPSERECARERI